MPGWIPAAIGVAGSIIGGATSAAGQLAANRMNLRISRENRDFQERMSNTAVERRMADMARSGINPLLAGRYDASTPPGNIATMGNVGASFTTGAAAGAAVSRTALEMIGVHTANERAELERELAGYRIPRARTINDLFKLGQDGLQLAIAIVEAAGTGIGTMQMQILDLLEYLVDRLPSSKEIDDAAGWQKGDRFGGKP